MSIPGMNLLLVKVTRSWVLSTISLYVKTRVSIASKPGFSGLKNHGLPGIQGSTNPGLDSLLHTVQCLKHLCSHPEQLKMLLNFV